MVSSPAAHNKFPNLEIIVNTRNFHIIYYHFSSLTPILTVLLFLIQNIAHSTRVEPPIFLVVAHKAKLFHYLVVTTIILTFLLFPVFSNLSFKPFIDWSHLIEGV